MIVASLLASSILVFQPPPANLDDAVQRFTLDNGLRVRLMDVPGGAVTAMVVLFDVGEGHNLPGKSGLAHYVEHFHVTSAAGETPARTVDELMAAYPRPGGSNAQTGIDYTVVATIFTPQRLPAEIDDAAARMGDLRIEPGDLQRELPRMAAELGNMYGDYPHLTASNHAREAVDPVAPGARRGGIIEQLETVTVEEARDWHRRYYKPRNAMLVIVGPMDVDEARAHIEQAFGDISTGEAPPPTAAPAPTREGTITRLATQRPGFGIWPAAMASVCYRSPTPDSEDFAPFLVILGRLQMLGWPEAQKQMMRQQQGHMALAALQFTPIDDARVVYLQSNLEGAPEDDAVIGAIRGRVGALLEADVNIARWRRDCMEIFGLMLGLIDPPRGVLANNPYVVAFSMGRMEQIGLDRVALRQAVNDVTEADLRRCVEAVFGDARGAGVVVTIE